MISNFKTFSPMSKFWKCMISHFRDVTGGEHKTHKNSANTKRE